MRDPLGWTEPGRAAGVRHLLFILIVPLAASAGAQSVPVRTASPLYTPFSIPTVNGTLQYSLTASERQIFGYEGGNGTDVSGSLSGNVAFVAPSVLRPFTMVYSGGYSLNSLGQRSQFNQSLSLTQGFNTQRWKFSVSDSVSYLPQTPSTGLSGIPGAGDVGVTTGVDTTQQILTSNTTRIGNTVSGNVSRQLSGKTSLSGQASYGIQRFLGVTDAIETDNLGAGGSLAHRIDARTSVSAGYTYSEFSYRNDPGSFSTQGGTLTYQRQLTRQLNLSAGAGPQFVGGSSITGRPDSLTYSADARLSFTGSERTGANMSLSYVRSVNSGDGSSLGAETDSVSLVASRRITRSLQPSAQVSFTRSAGLAIAGTPALDTDSLIVSTQANRAISRVASVYISYTAEHQTYGGRIQGLAPQTGLTQTLAFGITYSPRSMHVGR